MSYKRFSTLLLFELFIFTLVKLEIITDSITLNNENESFNLNENKYYRVITNSISEDKNYMKILIEAENSNNEFALSYYQEDSTFKNRKQLSQSISGKSFIYIKKELLNKDFYISIIFEESPSKYTLNFIQKEKMELDIGEQYSYYVTEENQKMNFTIIGNPQIIYTNNEQTETNNLYKLSIWAKGSQNIITELNPKVHDLTKNRLNTYIVERESLNPFSFNFYVEGEIGDLIKIGTFFFNKNNLCQTPIYDYKMVVFGLLKNHIMESISFLIPKSTNIKFNPDKVIDYNSQISLIRNLSPQNYNNDFEIYTFTKDNNKVEEIYYFKFKSNKPNKINVDPIIIGVYYMISLNKGEFIGLDPLKTQNNKDFKYQINSKIGKYKSSIINCDNYPFCIKDEKTKSITDSKNENDYNISPIHQNQQLLLLSCESEKCEINTNIYTDKISLFPSTPYYHNTQNEDIFEIYLNEINTKIHFFIYIEIISGDFNPKVEINGKLQENTKPYEFESDKNFNLKIKVNKTTVYSIIITKEDDDLRPQLNYKLKFNNNNERTINLFKDSNDKSLYYVSFYSLDCDIEVKNSQNSIIQNSTKIYYQDFYNPNSSPAKYSIKNNSTKKDCYFGLSLFKYTKENNIYDSIVLSLNTEYSFIFTKDYNIVKYMYIHSEKEKGISINLKVFENVNYNMHIFINDISYKDITFNKNNDINIISDDLKKNIDNNNQPIKINFIIMLNNAEKNHLIKIKIIDYIKNENENKTIDEKDIKTNNDKTKRLIIIIGCSVIGVLVILVIIIVIIICKSKKSYDDLKEKINSISFKSDGITRDSNGDDDLLI